MFFKEKAAQATAAQATTTEPTPETHATGTDILREIAQEWEKGVDLLTMIRQVGAISRFNRMQPPGAAYNTLHQKGITDTEILAGAVYILSVYGAESMDMFMSGGKFGSEKTRAANDPAEVKSVDDLITSIPSGTLARVGLKGAEDTVAAMATIASIGAGAKDGLLLVPAKQDVEGEGNAVRTDS